MSLSDGARNPPIFFYSFEDMAETLCYYAPDHPALSEIQAKIAAGIHTPKDPRIEPQVVALPPTQPLDPTRHYRTVSQPAAQDLPRMDPVAPSSASGKITFHFVLFSLLISFRSTNHSSQSEHYNALSCACCTISGNTIRQGSC